MGWRYRKRIKIMPGLHVNISKSGISTNIGVKGANVTFGQNGTYVNTGIPGFGLYRRDKIVSSVSSMDTGYNSYMDFNSSVDAALNPSFPIHNRRGSYIIMRWFLYVVALLMPIVGFLLYGHVGWWMFFCCLLVDVVQLICFGVIHTNRDIQNEDIIAIPYTGIKGIIGCIVEAIISCVLILLNFFPFFAMSRSFVHMYNGIVDISFYFLNETYGGGLFVSLMTIVMMGTWLINTVVNVQYALAIKSHIRQGNQTQSDVHTRQQNKEFLDDKAQEDCSSICEANIFGKQQISVYTSQGNLIKLPLGATVIDLAYQVHSCVGEQCVGACISNKNVDLFYQLQDGECVEILTSSNQKPDSEWINHVRTSRAKEQIQRFLCRERNKETKEGDFVNLGAEASIGNDRVELGDINTPYDPKLDLEFYKYPTLDLLKKANDEGPLIDMIEQNANKDRIIHVLKNFGVEIASIKATIGPTITLYEIVPAEGTRISKIRNLEDDIALSLAAEGIRIIAPIPGKGTIGIEVPNKKKSIVSMESVINSRVYQESKMELPCAVGKTISNEVFMFDLAKAPHLLVAGATGQGKSVGLNAIVTSLLYKKHPSELKIVMVDPKKVEFSIYSPIENHFLARLEEEEDCIISDVQKVVKTLNSLCQLMDTRYDLLKRAHVRHIKKYNEKFKNRQLNPEQGHEYMPYIVVIVNEFYDLIMTAGKEVELPICRISQLAHAVGIHMIIATQRPQASIISGAIKTHFPTRIAFKVASMMDSRVILDRGGANQLIGKGDMLYSQGGEPVRVQCAFVDTSEVNDVCHYIAAQQGFLHPMYLPEVTDAEGDGAGMGTVGEGRLDPMLGDVAKFVVNNQSGSTSMIQRNFLIDYNRAGKIMDQLEKMGVVGAQVGSKPREVIIKDPLTLEGLLNTLCYDRGIL